jgi:micrococcal nuclease
MRLVATPPPRCRPLVALGLAALALGGCRAPGPPPAAQPLDAPRTAATAVPVAGQAQRPEQAGVAAVVVRVVDGDTVDVRVDGRDERIRLIGIDTPETKKPGSPVECFGPEAADRLAALLPVGSEVRLLGDVEPRDDYGRLLAYVFLPDGRFVNLSLVADGYATTLRIEPNTSFSPELRAAEAAASTGRVGLWAACPRPNR